MMKEEKMSGRISARFVIFSASILLVVAIVAVVLWQMFYRRDYRRVCKELERIGTVEIIETWAHKDTTIEDFGVAVRSPKGREFHLYFNDDDKTSELFRDAVGVVLSTGTEEKAFDFGDDSIFKKHGGLNISNARELIENIDEVLDLLQGHSDEGKPYNRWSMKKYIVLTSPYDRNAITRSLSENLSKSNMS